MAEKQETTQEKPKAGGAKEQGVVQAGLVVNNSFIDGLSIQLTEKTKYGLSFPENYNVSNALNGAYLLLQDITTGKADGSRPVLQACTKQSIASALMSMAIQGLNPMKKQCYFVAYKDKLTLMRSYQGTISVAKRVGVKNVVAEVIYKDDIFEYHIQDGVKVIDKHVQAFANIGSEIIGAYAVVDIRNEKYIEIMTMGQITNAWKMSRTYSADNKVQKDFGDQMAKKTVINRALKNIINSADDAYLADEFEQTHDGGSDITADNVVDEIEQNANTVDFEEEDNNVIEEPAEEEPDFMKD